MPQSRQVGRRQRVKADTVLEFMRVPWAMDHELQRAWKRLTRDLGITGPNLWRTSWDAGWPTPTK